MKYIAGGIFAVLVLCAYISVSVSEAYAFGISKPFGGLVTITTTPGVSCDGGTGPVQINPAGSSPSSDYYFPDGSKQAPTTGSWVLGNYMMVQDFTSCHEDDEDNTPYPVYRVTLFGASGGSGSSFGLTGSDPTTSSTSTTESSTNYGTPSN